MAVGKIKVNGKYFGNLIWKLAGFQVDNNLISAAFVYLVIQIPCRKSHQAQLA